MTRRFLSITVETTADLADDLSKIAAAIADGVTEGPNWEVSA